MKTLIKYVVIILFSMTLVQCEFESEDPILDEFDKEYSQGDLYVDKYGNEGIVAYVHPSKAYAMVVSVDEAYLPWGPIDRAVIEGDTINKYGINHNEFGLAVLQYMQAIGLEKFPAQAWCYAKNKNEEFAYSGSWRLPSYEEYVLYIWRWTSFVKEFNKAVAAIGGTPIDENKMYWTATEDFNNYITLESTVSDYDKESRAVVVSPKKKFYSDKDLWLKKNHYYVRAIKYIYVSK